MSRAKDRHDVGRHGVVGCFCSKSETGRSRSPEAMASSATVRQRGRRRDRCVDQAPSDATRRVDGTARVPSAVSYPGVVFR